MSEKILDYLEQYVEKDSLFHQKKVLQSDYTPDEISHRAELVQQMVEILAPALRKEKPSNLFLYGKTGTGKTVTAYYTTDKVMEVAKKRNIPITVLYVNCKLKKVADTEYRLVAEFIRLLGGSVPATGLPTEEIYSYFFNLMEQREQVALLILDEIDQLVHKAGDEVLYSLTRMNAHLKKSQVSFIGISNDIMFIEHLDPRIKSSLSEEELLFPPYNAVQLRDILTHRATIAFKENAIQDGVIQKCAAYAARDHGDARRALELLRVAGEVAEREGKGTVDIDHVDAAEGKIEKDRILDSIKVQPKQFHVVLYAIVLIHKQQKALVYTGEVYELYKDYCDKTNLRPLTQRRISDIIGELDLLGIIHAKTISKGRYGRTRNITFSIPQYLIQKIEKFLHSKLEL